MREYHFQVGRIPTNKKILSEEETIWLKENYNKVTKTVIAEKLELTGTSVWRIMKRMGLKRTEDEIKRIISLKKKRDDSWIKKIMSIEGGGRGKHRANYHLASWKKKFGAFSDKKVLVYNNARYESFDDLVLINRKSYETFIKSRDIKLYKESLKKEKEKERTSKFIEIQKKKELKTQIQETKKKKRDLAQKMEEMFDSIKNRTVPKSIKEANKELREENRVPVKVDSRTTIWVRRDKCIQQEDKTWVRL